MPGARTRASKMPPMKVGIIGLGYVCLPLANAFAEDGHDVVGIDAEGRKVEALGLVLDFRGVTGGIEASNLVRL